MFKAEKQEPEIFSLLWPHNKETYSGKIRKLSAAAVDNLNLKGLCAVAVNGEERENSLLEFLSEICCDEEVIRYRQDIFRDIMNSEKLTASVGDIVEQLESLSWLNNQTVLDADAKLWYFFSRLRALGGYIDCANAIMQALCDVELKSLGLGRLKELIRRICEDEKFEALKKTVDRLGLETNEIKSINLGINLDSSMNPNEATLVSVNKTKFIDNCWYKDFIPTVNTPLTLESWGYVSKIHKISPDKRDPIMYNLYRDIERMLKPVERDLTSGLRRYAGLCTGGITGLIPELKFYLYFVRLAQKLKQSGMPVCLPEVRKKEERVFVAEGCYNINLALHMLENHENPQENIVLNDVRFDDGGRIFILTGPNRGGKTVYTEAVGLAQVLSQAGVFVPAANASISPVDSVCTHFPVEEDRTVEMGRLGEESKRFDEIFSEATKFSLVLMNESLTSTSFSEGMYLALDIIRAFRFLGARAVFNTHMHELASHADEINREIPGDSKVISLVTGMSEGRRSYKVIPGAPLGKSYAMDIARKYGISYDQIVEKIKVRNGTADQAV